MDPLEQLARLVRPAHKVRLVRKVIRDRLAQPEQLVIQVPQEPLDPKVNPARRVNPVKLVRSVLWAYKARQDPKEPLEPMPRPPV